MKNTFYRHAIELEGHHLPVIVKRRRAARRMTIRYQPIQHAVSLTLPFQASMKQGLNFVERQRDWISRQLAEHARKVPFADGQRIPVLGKDCRLKHVAGRGLVRQEGDEILVPGAMEFMPRRVRDFLKKQARSEITRLAGEKASMIGKKVVKLSLRDTTSLWGSCSHKGHLSFSWRLIFAPPRVLDYLVAHEVAHLVHLNHSRKFWDTVASLCPHYKEARNWLKIHGAQLYGYG